MSEPWAEAAWTLYDPRIRLFESEPSSAGTVRRSLAVFDAADFSPGDDPAAALWGDALDEHLYGTDDDDDDDEVRGYPKGWLEHHARRIAGALDDPGFRHPVFPLHLAASTGRLEPVERARVEAGPVLLEQCFMVDVGMPTLYVALRRDPADPARIRVRGADHSHRDGHPHPESWSTMGQAWGNRRFEFVAPWEAFWTAYEAFWSDRARPS